MLELAPVSLWVEDFSAVKRLFDELRRRGVDSLGDYLRADFMRVKACSDLIVVVKVNQKTLQLFEANSLGHLTENLSKVFRDDMLATHIEELVQIWDGKQSFTSNTVNYTLSGRRLDIQLKGTILPGYKDSWERVLIAIEDVTERETARRRLAASEAYARGLFHHSPVSLWVEDFSVVKQLMDDVRRRGIVDFRVFTDVHSEFVSRCMSEIRVIDVNRHTLEIFAAPDKATLLKRLPDVFRDSMIQHFREQLVDLWNGKLLQQREVVNYALDGRELHLHLQFSVLPGHENDWSLVQVALTDITARKVAEAYLEILGKHDVMTKLFNRSFFVEELNRLQRNGPHPVSIVIADLNGLKEVNDQWGHAAGDDLLRRVGDVFGAVAEKPAHASRIGGDELAITIPGANQAEVETVVENILKLIELNDQFHSSATLSLSIGSATSSPGERLEDVVKRADAAMYEAKRSYYRTTAIARRAGGETMAPRRGD